MQTTEAAWERFRNADEVFTPYLEESLSVSLRCLKQLATSTIPQEVCIRVRCLWAFNHPFRAALRPSRDVACRLTGGSVIRSKEFYANAERLLSILDRCVSIEALLLSEILRELERYDACLDAIRQARAILQKEETILAQVIASEALRSSNMIAHVK